MVHIALFLKLLASSIPLQVTFGSLSFWNFTNTEPPLLRLQPQLFQ